MIAAFPAELVLDGVIRSTVWVVADSRKRVKVGISLGPIRAWVDMLGKVAALQQAARVPGLYVRPSCGRSAVAHGVSHVQLCSES